jgi:hypothetical protein
MDNIPDPRVPDEPPDIERQFEISDLLSRADGPLQLPPALSLSPPFPISSEEFEQLWALAHAMVTFGLSALLELQTATDEPPTEDPAVAGTLLWSAYDYLNARQLPPRPDLDLDASEWRNRLVQKIRERWKSQRKRPTAGEIAFEVCPPTSWRRDATADQKKKSAAKALDRLLHERIKTGWREFIKTVPPP